MVCRAARSVQIQPERLPDIARSPTIAQKIEVYQQNFTIMSSNDDFERFHGPGRRFEHPTSECRLRSDRRRQKETSRTVESGAPEMSLSRCDISYPSQDQRSITKDSQRDRELSAEFRRASPAENDQAAIKNTLISEGPVKNRSELPLADQWTARFGTP